MLKSIPAILLGIFLAGCVTQRQSASLPPSHPASPEAAAAPEPRRTTTLALNDAPAAPADEPSLTDHGHAAHGGADAAGDPAYVCPMHPKVTSDNPNRCPECGMKLVKPEDVPKSGKDAHDHHDHGGHP